MGVSTGLCLRVVARMKLKAAQRSLGKVAVTEHMLRHLLLGTKARAVEEILPGATWALVSLYSLSPSFPLMNSCIWTRG